MSTTMPLVSVIIPNYNYDRFLRQAIDSVLEQSYPHVELIVVDDGSTDDSVTVLRSYEHRVRWFRQPNKGVSSARNRGVQESRGELVAFLDADDVWLPMKLERQVQRWTAQPDLGLVHCGETVVDVDGTPLRSRLEGLEGWVATEMLRYRRVVIVAPASAALVPRQTFDAVGGFDPQLSTFADWDFCYRIAVRQRVGFVPEILVNIRSLGTSMQRNVMAMEHDMLLAYAKAFRDAGPEVSRLRRQCYGHIHMVLAGSFFGIGRPWDCARHLLKSLWLTPSNCKRVFGFPARWWRRRQMLCGI